MISYLIPPCSHSVRDRLTQQREIVEGHWVFNVQREEFPGLLGGCLVSMFGIKRYTVCFPERVYFDFALMILLFSSPIPG